MIVVASHQLQVPNAIRTVARAAQRSAWPALRAQGHPSRLAKKPFANDYGISLFSLVSVKQRVVQDHGNGTAEIDGGTFDSARFGSRSPTSRPVRSEIGRAIRYRARSKSRSRSETPSSQVMELFRIAAKRNAFIGTSRKPISVAGLKISRYQKAVLSPRSWQTRQIRHNSFSDSSGVHLTAHFDALVKVGLHSAVNPARRWPRSADEHQQRRVLPPHVTKRTDA